MCETMSKRIYYCNQNCDFEFLKIDLTIESQDILINETEEKIFRYIISNVGSKDIFGDVIIMSKNFKKIKEENVLLKENETIVIEKIGIPIEDEITRAFFKIKNTEKSKISEQTLWIHSELIKLNSNLISNISSSNISSSNISSFIQEINPNNCYLTGVISKFILGSYHLEFRIYNLGNIDAVNTIAIINFDNSVNNLTIVPINTPPADYVIERNRLIFNFGIFQARDSKLFRINFTGQPIVFAELLITTDTPNDYKNLLPIVGFSNST